MTSLTIRFKNKTMKKITFFFIIWHNTLTLMCNALLCSYQIQSHICEWLLNLFCLFKYVYNIMLVMCILSLFTMKITIIIFFTFYLKKGNCNAIWIHVHFRRLLATNTTILQSKYIFERHNKMLSCCFSFQKVTYVQLK